MKMRPSDRKSPLIAESRIRDACLQLELALENFEDDHGANERAKEEKEKLKQLRNQLEQIRDQIKELSS